VFRYGGEELVVLLPEQDILNALQVIEKIRKAIFELGIEHKKSPHQVVTISSGVSVFHKSAETWETVLDWADMALYRAKAAGRNCIRSRTFPYVYHDNKNLALKKERNYSGIAE
jgi:diguanylate cyclase (GGDEF)-like protein